MSQPLFEWLFRVESLAAGLGQSSADLFGAIAEGFQSGAKFAAFGYWFQQSQRCGSTLLLPALLEPGTLFQAESLGCALADSRGLTQSPQIFGGHGLQ